MPRKSGWLTAERRSLIAGIIANYNCDWNRAFTENPEWVQKLDYESQKGKKNCWNTATRFRRQVKAKRRSMAVERVVVEAAVPEQPKPEPGYCPQCGFNLLVFKAAFLVALKHSAKGPR
jgi:hypothetical protein